jgi:hypothetical protein
MFDSFNLCINSPGIISKLWNSSKYLTLQSEYSKLNFIFRHSHPRGLELLEWAKRQLVPLMETVPQVEASIYVFVLEVAT